MKFKKLGVLILVSIIELFKNIFEDLGDDDSDDEGKKVKPTGPPVLQQHEA